MINTAGLIAAIISLISSFVLMIMHVSGRRKLNKEKEFSRDIWNKNCDAHNEIISLRNLSKSKIDCKNILDNAILQVNRHYEGKLIIDLQNIVQGNQKGYVIRLYNDTTLLQTLTYNMHINDNDLNRMYASFIESVLTNFLGRISLGHIQYDIDRPMNNKK